MTDDIDPVADEVKRLNALLKMFGSSIIFRTFNRDGFFILYEDNALNGIRWFYNLQDLRAEVYKTTSE